MSKHTPLDALIRRVSRMAEQMFDKQGDIDPIWLVETVSGEQQIIVSPVMAPSALSAGDYKDKLAAKMRETFADLDVVRYAHAAECWTVDAEMTEEQFALHYPALGYTLANHPNRREVVLCEAEDGTEVLTAFRDIVRPAHGKPYLGKLGAIERRRSLYGRWIGLLPSKEHAQALRPEAERLILSVHRWLTEREEAEGLTIEQFMAKYHEQPETKP